MAWQWLEKIRQKIINFDIKPAKPIIPDLLQKVDELVVANDYIQANKILKKLLALNNANHETLSKSILVNMNLGRFYQIEILLKHAIKHYPNDFDFLDTLGTMYLQRGNIGSANKCYARAYKINPNATGMKHFLDAIAGNNTSHAPREYIVDLFDSYASGFENSLVNRLSYRAHIILGEYLSKVISPNKPLLKVLDLGCGTGLLGQELLKHFTIEHLAGVDLSPRMLEHSSAKNIYQSLHNVDLLEYLRGLETNVDIIASSDALIYLGDLSSVFEHCHRVLTPGGYFAFTLEQTWWGGYKLSLSGRYQHSMRYIKSLYKRYQFSKMYSQTIDLRKECGNMVAGYLVLFQK